MNNKEKQLKAEFLEIEGREHGKYTIQQLQALLEMAKANVYPDGRFGDLDVSAWSLFTEAIRYGKGVE